MDTGPVPAKDNALFRAVVSTVMLMFGLVNFTTQVADFDGLPSVGQIGLSVGALGLAWWLTDVHWPLPDRRPSDDN